MSEAAAAAGAGGWGALDQLLVQLTGVGATIAWAAVGTIVICLVVEKTIGFRLDEDKEVVGIDYTLHGEHGYGLVNS